MKKRMVALMFTVVLALTGLCGCGASAKPAAQNGGSESGEANVGIANPWVEINEDEADSLCPNMFKAPEGAKVSMWQKCESLGDPDKGIGPMIELDFTYDDMDFNARAQQGISEDTDISGIYGEWTVGPDDATIPDWGGADLPGKTYRSVDDLGYTDLITWYDSNTKVKYSLSVNAKDLDGFDIQGVAEQMRP